MRYSSSSVLLRKEAGLEIPLVRKVIAISFCILLHVDVYSS